MSTRMRGEFDNDVVEGFQGIPSGVVAKIRVTAAEAADVMLAEQFNRFLDESFSHTGGIAARMRDVAMRKRNSYYDRIAHEWVGRDELVERMVSESVTRWLSEFGALSLALCRC